MFNRLARIFKRLPVYAKVRYSSIYFKLRGFTMIPPVTYINNLMVAEKFFGLEGCVVECGTWRGGMVAGIAKLMDDPNRKFYLFDSFEGLPEATAVDGDAAIDWQNDKNSPDYFDNCTAEMSKAQEAMAIAGINNPIITKGWFSDTLPHFDKSQKIAILRLDGDWYSSTMDCLENLYDSVVVGGVIVLDDYYAWDGCSRAVHDFLSKRGLSDRIHCLNNSVWYIEKRGVEFKHEDA